MNMKGNNKVYGGTNHKMKTRKNMLLLLNGAGSLMTENVEKTRIISALFTLALLVRFALRNSENTMGCSNEC